MAKTPEGAVKAKVRQILGNFDGMYTYWPVPSGYGQTTLDVIGCYRGHFFSIETKAPGKKPTLRQVSVINEMEYAQGKVFVIDSTSDPRLRDLEAWLLVLSKTVPHDTNLSQDPVRRRPI
jgi:hypothetical protein